MKWRALPVFFIVLLLSYLTFVRDYATPPNLFWDENYHIASAQKYLNQVFFMEPHPPLGKLFIALGEALIDANRDDSSFATVDHGKSIPKDFSFVGYRFFPVLFAWAVAPLLFLIIMYLTGSLLAAFFFSLCCLFDNALVVHSRGAMLETTQIFFILLTIFCVVVLYRRIKEFSWLGGVPYFCGIALGCALTTKATSLIVLPFFLILFPVLWGKVRFALKVFLQIFLATVVTFCVIWQIHFSLGRRIEPTLPNQGFYQASAETKAILREGVPSNPANFPILFKDALSFFAHYERGVPRLNLCNSVENGSLPYLWPLGARSINYRWDKKDGAVRYTYLQVNPVVWLIGLISLMVMGAFLIVWLTGHIELDREWLIFSFAFFLMWLGYMAVMVSLDRVMYLYHYFIPLIFTLIMGALICGKLPLQVFGRYKLKAARAIIGGTLILVFAAFRFYSPLTYGSPLTDTQLKERSLLSLWDLHCAGCELTNLIARPVCNPKEKSAPRIQIGQLYAQNAYQEWGDPVQGATVENSPIIIGGDTYKSGIGTHAYSVIRFPIGKRFFNFSGKAGLPDYLKTKEGQPASVIFEVWLDNTQIWRSRRLTPNDQLQNFSLSVIDGNLLELRVLDGGDGNGSDHAVWVDLDLR